MFQVSGEARSALEAAGTVELVGEPNVTARWGSDNAATACLLESIRVQRNGKVRATCHVAPIEESLRISILEDSTERLSATPHNARSCLATASSTLGIRAMALSI